MRQNISQSLCSLILQQQRHDPKREAKAVEWPGNYEVNEVDWRANLIRVIIDPLMKDKHYQLNEESKNNT